MESYPIKKLKDDVFKRVSILALIGLEDLLSIDDRVGGDEVFATIVEQALNTFEFYEPLRLHTNINLSFTNGIYTFTDTFSAYVAGITPEDLIELIPNQVVGFSDQFQMASSYDKNFIYERPTLRQGIQVQGMRRMYGLYSRPLVIEYVAAGKEFKNTSKIYYMSDKRDPVSNAFIDQLTLDLADYLLRIRQNFPVDLPVDIFGGMDTLIQKLEPKMEKYYNECIKGGNLLK